MQTIPGTLMSDEPYALTAAQMEALNSLPPGVYHVCSRCREFQPMSTTISFVAPDDMVCERCAH